jgi:putative ABC transport system permease protein
MLPATFPLPRVHEIGIDPAVLTFTASIALSAGVLFGLMPAFQSRRLDLTRDLHQSSRSVASSHRLRGVLVVAEIALALMLVTGAGLMIRSFLRLNHVEPGFQAERVLTLRMLLLPARERVFHAQVVNDVLERVRALPQLVAAGSIGILPMNGSNSGTWYYRADQPEPRPGERPGGDVSIITPGYFQAMAIPLLKGRDFDERDRMGSPKVAILNQTAARMFFADQDPLGKRVSVSWNDAREVQIVGVVADIRHSQLHTRPDPCLFLPNAQQPFPFSSLVVRTTGDPLSLAAAVKEQVRQVDPDQGVSEVQTMEQLVADSVASPRLQTLLLSAFGFLALTLACIGIYGSSGIRSASGRANSASGSRSALLLAQSSIWFCARGFA